MSKTKRYWHDVVGYNYRMTNLQAAIGLAQLERIEEIHKNRREYENNYKNLLSSNKFLFQNDIKNRTRITWLVSVLLAEDVDRDDFIQKLKDKGIDARTFFYPLSDMEIYNDFCKNETPIAHKLSRIGLNLPTYESLISIKDIKIILKDFVHV
jgi:perosamine synthetase